MVVNVPLAYVLSIPFAFINERMFLPVFVVGYWLTNIAGFILMHIGVAGLPNQQNRNGGIGRLLVIASIYSAIIILMVWLQWIPIPTEFIQKGSG